MIFSQEEQVSRIMANIRHWDSDLDKYVYLAGLQDRNEKLFYKIITDHIEELAPIIYTPTVGQACSTYGFIFRKPRLVRFQMMCKPNLIIYTAYKINN